MPRLEWIGKDKVVNHAKEVPFHVLERKYGFGDEDTGNMVVHGDNLVALKSLLPEYEGKVKFCSVDTSKNRRVAITFKVMSQPTFLFWKDGAEAARLGGDETGRASCRERV